MRLRETYADVALQPRYVEAIRFFENDLYGSGDYAQRDADVARIAPIMVRMLPEAVIATIAQAVELNAMSHELDADLLAHLPRGDTDLNVLDYCNAYRAMGRRQERERQIRLIVEIGAALDAHVRRPLVRSALHLMGKPAHLAGFGALHDFLERGFSAFRTMRGAELFLGIVQQRETALMERILAGERTPFPEPRHPRG